MGQKDGFLLYKRALPKNQPAEERIKHSQEFSTEFNEKKINEQAARCMDCGVPFCHSGCPLGNFIPEFNDAVYQKDWKLAYQILSSTNNFPEFTGRICPAPCEGSCVLGLNNDPVSIENIEKTIVERAFVNGWIKPTVVAHRTGKKVAVVGSGPAGMATADQLNKAGHQVTVFEKSDEVGGLLRYGIPDFKLSKDVVVRRVKLMEHEGVVFKTSIEIGKDISIGTLEAEYDAVVLTIGSTVPRDLPIKGRSLKGVYPAMDFLTQHNRRVSKKYIGSKEEIWVEGKNVVVIGGGDTGSDCIGTSNRQKANKITQIELLNKPGTTRGTQNPWPEWPMVLKTSTSHEEGCNREWAILTKAFLGDGKGNLRAIETVHIDWELTKANGGTLVEIEGTEEEIPCNFVFLAMGFVHPFTQYLAEEAGLELDARGNIKAESYQTKNEKIFVAGDARRGQSLVVWAISEGREAAKKVDEFLVERTGSVLASKDKAYIHTA